MRLPAETQRELEGPRQVGCAGDPAKVATGGIQLRPVKDGVVEGVECFHSQLRAESLDDANVLDHAEIDVVDLVTTILREGLREASHVAVKLRRSADAKLRGN